jgi:hypothetical protein
MNRDHRRSTRYTRFTQMALASGSRFVIVLFLLIYCASAVAGDAAPYQFNGIVLDSPEAELPKAYRAVFRESDCHADRLGQRPVKRCGKDFQSHAFPGLPPGVKGPVHFYVNYVSGRLQQVGFILRRDDYAPFVAALIKQHGEPRTARAVLMDSVKETEYTWNRGRYSIATYAFHRDTTRSAVTYSVIAPIDDRTLKSLGVKP